MPKSCRRKSRISVFCEFCEIFKNTFFTEHLQATVKSKLFYQFTKHFFQQNSFKRPLFTIVPENRWSEKSLQFSWKNAWGFLNKFVGCILARDSVMFSCKIYIFLQNLEASSGSYQTSMMEVFAKIVNGFQSLTILAKTL